MYHVYSMTNACSANNHDHTLPLLYVDSSSQEAAETILAAEEPSWQKLKRMFTVALAKAWPMPQ
jgi:hypothetical protein